MNDKAVILVVDDEPIMLSLLEKIFTREGYSVLKAPDGNEALKELERGEVDIVISDVQMPNLDGFGLLKAIKRDYAGIRTIMMTGYGDIYTVKDALLLGADEYITKPFRSHEITLVVEKVYWKMMSSRVETGTCE